MTSGMVLNIPDKIIWVMTGTDAGVEMLTNMHRHASACITHTKTHVTRTGMLIDIHTCVHMPHTPKTHLTGTGVLRNMHRHALACVTHNKKTHLTGTGVLRNMHRHALACVTHNKTTCDRLGNLINMHTCVGMCHTHPYTKAHTQTLHTYLEPHIPSQAWKGDRMGPWGKGCKYRGPLINLVMTSTIVITSNNSNNNSSNSSYNWQSQVTLYQ